MFPKKPMARILSQNSCKLQRGERRLLEVELGVRDLRFWQAFRVSLLPVGPRSPKPLTPFESHDV